MAYIIKTFESYNSDNDTIDILGYEINKDGFVVSDGLVINTLTETIPLLKDMSEDDTKRVLTFINDDAIIKMAKELLYDSLYSFDFDEEEIENPGELTSEEAKEIITTFISDF